VFTRRKYFAEGRHSLIKIFSINCVSSIAFLLLLYKLTFLRPLLTSAKPWRQRGCRRNCFVLIARASFHTTLSAFSNVLAIARYEVWLFCFSAASKRLGKGGQRNVMTCFYVSHQGDSAREYYIIHTQILITMKFIFIVKM
jgi:hypothetical protein